MASKGDLRSYFSVVSENVKKDSRISIPEIIISRSDDVSQTEVDIAKEKVKKQVAKRRNYQNVPEKVRKEFGRFSLVHGTKAAMVPPHIEQYSWEFCIFCSIIDSIYHQILVT